MNLFLQDIVQLIEVFVNHVRLSHSTSLGWTDQHKSSFIGIRYLDWDNKIVFGHGNHEDNGVEYFVTL